MCLIEHYQFFPLAILTIALIAYGRRKEISPKIHYGGILGHFGFGIAVVLLFASLSLGLVLIGWVSFVIFLISWIYVGFGWKAARASLPFAAALLIIKPLPEALEQPLTISMQELASYMGGQILDLVGVLHYRRGVVIVSPNADFFAEEACSGIRSLFSSITAVVIWGVLNRYHWFRHIANILQTFFWVMAVNAVRIALVIFVEDRSDYSIASGWPHQIVGVACFFMIFGAVLSTDGLFASIVLPRRSFPMDEVSSDATKENSGTTFPWGLRIWVSVLLVLGFFETRLLFMQPATKNLAEAMIPSDQADITEGLMGWKVKSFEHIHRDSHALEGGDSYAWQLVKDDRFIILSVDGSFPDFHDLEWCYRALGWNCVETREYRSLISTASSDLSAKENLCNLHVFKPSGESGFVIFSAADHSGRDVYPDPSLGMDWLHFIRERMVNSLRFAIGLTATESAKRALFSPPVSTIQLSQISTDVISEKDQMELRKVFLEARNQLRVSSRFSK